MVRDIIQAFDDGLTNMLDLVDTKNYLACKELSSELIIISYHGDLDDGIFIGEMLESAFSQVDNLTSIYQISDKYQNDIRDKLKDQLILLSKSLKEKNKNNIYEALKLLRCIATKYQLSAKHFPIQPLGTHRGFLPR